MRSNEDTVICGDKVVLVPYRSEHVLTYHDWMQSEELLELTASERLSLEEEYEMQLKWHLDEDKLTFIILSRPPILPSTSHRILSPDQLKQCKMVGDVNMFLPEGKEGEGECEIMIANKQDRGRGYAREALSLFLKYATSTLPISASNLIARIGTTNQPSISLFHSLGFTTVKIVEVFQESELRYTSSSSPWQEIDLTDKIGSYDP